MKDRVITEIQTAMSSLLTPSQLIELRRVLTNCLHLPGKTSISTNVNAWCPATVILILEKV
jgi:hypothetical protein